MADETDGPGDVSSMMEELWGPRGEAPPDDIARRGGQSTAQSEVEALRADFDAALAALGDKVAEARDDAVAAADARVAGAETRLLSRLDEIAAGVAQAVERSAVGQSVVARLDVVEREASERFGEMQAELAALSAGAQHLARAQDDLHRTLEDLAEKVARASQGDNEADATVPPARD